jgi:hypothetical protein
MTTLTALAYSLGVVATAVEWGSYRCLCPGAFRRWSAAAAAGWALMYLLLGAWTAGLTMAVTAARTLLSGWLERQVNRQRAAIGFVMLFALLTALSWQGLSSLLPAFAVINTTLALFYLRNRPMRQALLASSAAWLFNDILWHAWPAFIAEAGAVAVNLHTLRRLGRPVPTLMAVQSRPKPPPVEVNRLESLMSGKAQVANTGTRTGNPDEPRPEFQESHPRLPTPGH